MSVKTKAVLKTYFESNDTPTQAQFGDLIDSMTVATELPPIGVQGVDYLQPTGNGEGLQGVIHNASEVDLSLADNSVSQFVTSGTAGATGPTGSGSAGLDGASGWSGLDGVQGVEGLTGVGGASGYTGIDGATGPSGSAGLDGATGIWGDSETDPVFGAWVAPAFAPESSGILEAGTDGTLYKTESASLVNGLESDPVVGAVTGIVMSDGAGNISEATPGTDYVVTETDPVVGAVTGLVMSDGAGNISAATPGTDYQSPMPVGTAPQLLQWGIDGATESWQATSVIVDGNLLPSIDPNARILYDTTGATPVVDWGTTPGTVSFGTNLFNSDTGAVYTDGSGDLFAVSMAAPTITAADTVYLDSTGIYNYAALTVVGQTTLDAALTGPLVATAGVVSVVTPVADGTVDFAPEDDIFITTVNGIITYLANTAPA